MSGFAVNGETSDNVLVPSTHEGIDHTAAPLNLLNVAAHDGIDHTLLSNPLLSVANHASLDHAALPGTNVGEDNFTQVTPAERTAGSSGVLRSFSPLDVATMAGIHGGGLSQTLRTLSWNANVSAQSTGGLGFNPTYAIAIGAFKHDAVDSGRMGTMSIGLLTGTGGNSVSTAFAERYAGSSTDAMVFRVPGTAGGVSGNADGYPDSDVLQENYAATTPNDGWNLAVTSWSSSGITITPQSGTGTITGSMYLLIFGN